MKKQILLIILLIIIMASGIISVIPIISRKLEFESNNKRVLICADFYKMDDSCKEASEDYTTTFIRMISEAGITSAALSELTLNDLCNEGNVYVQNTGMSPYGVFDSEYTVIIVSDEDRALFLQESLSKRLLPSVYSINVTDGTDRQYVIKISGNCDNIMNAPLGYDSRIITELIRNGIEVVLKMNSWNYSNTSYLDEYERIIKTYGIINVIFEKFSYKPSANLLKKIKTILNMGIMPGIIESANQSGFENSDSLYDLIEKNGLFRRVFITPEDRLADSDTHALFHMWLRGIADRNIRLILVSPFNDPGISNSANANDALAAASILKEYIIRHGYSTEASMCTDADANAGGDAGAGAGADVDAAADTDANASAGAGASASVSAGAGAGAGVDTGAGASVSGIPEVGSLTYIIILLTILLSAYIFYTLLRAKGKTWLPAAVIMTLAGFLFLPAYEIPVLAASIFYPFAATVSVLICSEHFNRIRIIIKLPMLLSIYLTINLTGSFIVAAIMTDYRYITGIKAYHGTLISYIAPLILISLFFLNSSYVSLASPLKVLLYRIFYRKPAISYRKPAMFDRKPTISDRKSTIKVTFKRILMFATGILFIYIYLARSGNSSIIPASGAELRFREILEYIFVARPRFKEYAIGYPCFFLFVYYFICYTEKTYKEALLFLLLIGLTIGGISIINSFCHGFTPLDVSLLRTLNGFVLGCFAGIGLLMAISLVHQMNRHIRGLKADNPVNTP